MDDWESVDARILNGDGGCITKGAVGGEFTRVTKEGMEWEIEERAREMHGR